MGRPVEIVSISFSNRPLTEISAIVEQEAAKGCDLIVLPETWRGNDAEQIDSEAVLTMRALAKRYNTYIIHPMFRLIDENKQANSAILIDREGEIVCIYDKVYPFWNEFDLTPPVASGEEAPVYQTDFGTIGMAICFDANFPEVWKRLAQQGAELVLWPSAYSAGTSLQAHAINHQFYIVTSTLLSDCIVYDITGKEIHYSKKPGEINISRITLDLDRRIFHENFNIDKRDALLKDYAGRIEQDCLMEREQWFTLRCLDPDVSVQQLAQQYGLEELRAYKERSMNGIDRMRGFRFVSKTI
ncbi:carbon-nitrogen hydrolase family protein [Paenibacillus sp. BC26]|uniref:carbon-nitrogen hydrolase family protein n=1 Tax=Paenibacillus sp. BC26 TaxID=1881032 RepID=UPI0015A571BC|nr:carbon-nitrogen hydrolase family protein [Paenibacillus sp. BC26]